MLSRSVACAAFCVATAFIAGCAGWSPMWDPSEFNFGDVSKSFGESRERGLLLGELETSHEAISVAGHRFVFLEGWVERKTKYDWTMFFGRLVEDSTMEVIVISLDVEPDIGYRLFYLSPVGEQTHINGVPPIRRAGSTFRWYCAVSKALSKIEIEARADGASERVRFELTRIPSGRRVGSGE